MKLEVGMYVRTKDGAIAKVEQIIDNEIHFDIKPIFSDGECLGYRWFYVKDVIKSSYNIIDLIEIGDYVNGEKVAYINDKRELLFCTMMKEHNSNWINEEDIKSIVTKEQFESMKYSLEG